MTQRQIFRPGDYVAIHATRVLDGLTYPVVSHAVVTEALRPTDGSTWEYAVDHDDPLCPLPSSFWNDGEMQLLQQRPYQPVHA